MPNGRKICGQPWERDPSSADIQVRSDCSWHYGAVIPLKPWTLSASFAYSGILGLSVQNGGNMSIGSHFVLSEKTMSTLMDVRDFAPLQSEIAFWDRCCPKRGLLRELYCPF